MQCFNDDDPGSGGSGEGGGSGGSLLNGNTPPSDWRASLPDDLKTEASLKDFKDVASLAKSYVHANRLVGQKRLPAPDAKWGDKEWNEFYNAIGRPESPDKYGTPEVKFEGEAKWDDEKLKTAKAEMHKLGLTDKQAKGLLAYYAGVINGQIKGSSEARAKSYEEAERTLRDEYKDQFSAKLDTAKAVLKKFGSDEMTKALIDAGFDNDPRMVKFLVNIGSAMMEDTTGGSGGSGLEVRDSTRAQTEIKQLMTDSEFMTALNSASHVGHKAAVDRWMELHRVAFPGVQE